MPQITTDLQSLPDEYQYVIHLAQEKYNITVTPLQLLVGGWSGAVVYLASISDNDTSQVQHCVLKLDRKNKLARSDEVTRHNTVESKSPPGFVTNHVPELVFDRVEHNGAIAIFYTIAGQSLINYRPLSSHSQQIQLTIIFEQTNTVLLDSWNPNPTFEQSVHPREVLEKWLGFRLKPGKPIEQFIQDVCHLHPEIPGFLINGDVFPNPLVHARHSEYWGNNRPIDIATGFIHGDLNTGNILVKFSDDGQRLDGCYLIDFALFKEQMPLFYDHRYLEMSYLLHAMSHVSFAKCVEFMTLLAGADSVEPHHAPIEMAGSTAVIASARSAFESWVHSNHPSLHDDLWAQYWLAGVAAGLAYCHKAGQSDESRLAGLVYAAANLKRYSVLFPLPSPAEVQQLYEANRFTLSAESGRLTIKSSSLWVRRHNLPAQLTPFIGREAQLTEIKDMLLHPGVRLVTLIGPGGTGKTRLSLQAAQEVLDEFPYGVFFIPLADDTDSDQLISRIAQQLAVKEGGRLLLENLKDFLREKSLLLVLDNFEQLVSSATVVSDLLADAPQLKVLVSSRIALTLQGEHEFPVPPLELPADPALTPGALADNEAVQLFVERAQSVQPNFTLTHDNASTVVEICRRLDGLPLALELAAPRLKLLSPQAILARLDDRLKLLTGGSRDLPARHQTLRSALEWSYDLLHEDEKRLYERLGVFVGGFSLEAAEAVCNAEGNLDILDGIGVLVNNSLLRQVNTPDGEPRFTMLETIRSYALERLSESQELETVQAQHARYFADIIINLAGFELYSAKAPYWLNWLERENDNVRATLSWSLSSPQRLEMAAGLVFSLAWFWYRRGYFIEGEMWAEQLLAFSELNKNSLLRGMALATGGLMALWRGKQQVALARMQEGLEIVQRLEDEFIVPVVLMGNGVAFINMGRDSDARPFFEQARRGFEDINHPYFHVITTIHLGNVELGLGSPEQAHALHEEALAKARAVDDNWLISFALNNLGEVARTQGQFDLARRYYEECQALLSDAADRGDSARFTHNLGYIAQHEGEYALAENQFRESLAMFRQLGNRRGIAECLAGLAGLQARQGHAEWAAVALGAAEVLLMTTGGAWWPADRIEVERTQEIIRSKVDEPELTAALEKGRAMTQEQVLAFALEGL